VLFSGDAAGRVAGTVSLVRDGHRVIVVDPGMVPTRVAVLNPWRSWAYLLSMSQTSY